MLQSGKIAPAPRTGDAEFDFMFADARPRSDLLHSYEALRSRRSAPYDFYADSSHGQVPGPLALPSGGAAAAFGPAPRKWRVGGASDDNVPSLAAFPNHVTGGDNLQGTAATDLTNQVATGSGRPAAAAQPKSVNQLLSNRSGKRALNFNASGPDSGAGTPAAAEAPTTGKAAPNSQTRPARAVPPGRDAAAHRPPSAAQPSAARVQPDAGGAGGGEGGARDMARRILQSRAGAVGQGSSAPPPPAGPNQTHAAPLLGQHPQPRHHAQPLTQQSHYEQQQQQNLRQRQRWQVPGRQSNPRGVASQPGGPAATGGGGGAGTLSRKPAAAAAAGGGTLQRSKPSPPGRQKWAPPPPQQPLGQPQRAHQVQHGPAQQQQQEQVYQNRQGGRQVARGATTSPGRGGVATPLTGASAGATPGSATSAVDMSGLASARRQKLEALKARRARPSSATPSEPGPDTSIASDLVSMVGYAEQVAAVDPTWARSATSPSPGRPQPGPGGAARSPHHSAAYYDSPTRVAGGGDARRAAPWLRSPERGTQTDPADLAGPPLRRDQRGPAASATRPSGPGGGKSPGAGDLGDTRHPADQRRPYNLPARASGATGGQSSGESGHHGLERRSQRDQGPPGHPSDGDSGQPEQTQRQSPQRQGDGGDASGRRVRMAEMVRRFREEPVVAASEDEDEGADGAQEEDEGGSPGGGEGDEEHPVDHLAAAVLQRSRAMLRERDVIQQRIEAALSRFGAGLGQQRSPRSRPHPPSVSPAGADGSGEPRAGSRGVLLVGGEAEVDGGGPGALGSAAVRTRSGDHGRLPGPSAGDSSGSEGALDVTFAAGISPGRERLPSASEGAFSSSDSGGGAAGGAGAVARRGVGAEVLGLAGGAAAGSAMDRAAARGRTAAPERQAPWRERLRALLAQAGVDPGPAASPGGVAGAERANGGGGGPSLAAISPGADPLPSDPLQAWRQLRQQQQQRSPVGSLESMPAASLGSSRAAATTSLVGATAADLGVAGIDGQDLVRRFDGTVGSHLPGGFSAARSALADWLDQVSDVAAGRGLGGGGDGAVDGGGEPGMAPSSRGAAPQVPATGSASSGGGGAGGSGGLSHAAAAYTIAAAAAAAEPPVPSVDDLLARLAQRFGLAPGTESRSLPSSSRNEGSGGTAAAVVGAVPPVPSSAHADGPAGASALAYDAVAGAGAAPPRGSAPAGDPTTSTAEQPVETRASSRPPPGLALPPQQSLARPDAQDAAGRVGAVQQQPSGPSLAEHMWGAGRQLAGAFEEAMEESRSSSTVEAAAEQPAAMAEPPMRPSPPHDSQSAAWAWALGPPRTEGTDRSALAASAAVDEELADEGAVEVEEELEQEEFVESFADLASEASGDPPVVAAGPWPGWLSALGIPRPVDPALLPAAFRSSGGADEDGDASGGEAEGTGVSERGTEDGSVQRPGTDGVGAPSDEAEDEDAAGDVPHGLVAFRDPAGTWEGRPRPGEGGGNADGSSPAHGGAQAWGDAAPVPARTATSSPQTPSGSAASHHSPAEAEPEPGFSTPVTQRPGWLRGGQQGSLDSDPRVAPAGVTGPRPVSFTPVLGSLLDQAVGGSLFADSPPPSTVKTAAQRQPEAVGVHGGSGDVPYGDSGDSDGGGEGEALAFWPIASAEPVAEFSPTRRQRLARGDRRRGGGDGGEDAGAGGSRVGSPGGLALRIPGDSASYTPRSSLASSGGARVAAILQHAVTAALFGDSPGTSFDMDRSGSNVFNRGFSGGVSGSGGGSAARLEGGHFPSAVAAGGPGESGRGLSRSAERLSPLGKRSAAAAMEEDAENSTTGGFAATAASWLPAAGPATGAPGGGAWGADGPSAAPPPREASAASIDPRRGITDVTGENGAMHRRHWRDGAPSGGMLDASAEGEVAEGVVGEHSNTSIGADGSDSVDNNGPGVNSQGSGGSTMFSEVYEEDFVEPSPQSSASAVSLAAVAAVAHVHDAAVVAQAAAAIQPAAVTAGVGGNGAGSLPGFGHPSPGASGPMQQQQQQRRGWDLHHAERSADPETALLAGNGVPRNLRDPGQDILSASGPGAPGAGQAASRRYADTAAAAYSISELSGDVLLGMSGCMDGGSSARGSGSGGTEPSGGEASPDDVSSASLDLSLAGLESGARYAGQGAPHQQEQEEIHQQQQQQQRQHAGAGASGHGLLGSGSGLGNGSAGARPAEARGAQAGGADAANGGRVASQGAAAAPATGAHGAAGPAPGRPPPGTSQLTAAAAAAAAAAWGPGPAGRSRAASGTVDSADEGSRTTDVPSSRGLEADRSASSSADSVSADGVPVHTMMYSLDIEELIMMSGDPARSSGAAAAAAAALAAAAAAAGMSFPEAAAAAAASGSFDIEIDPVTGESGLVFVVDDPLEALLFGSGGFGASGGVSLGRRVPPVVITEIGSSEEDAASVASATAAAAAAELAAVAPSAAAGAAEHGQPGPDGWRQQQQQQSDVAGARLRRQEPSTTLPVPCSASGAAQEGVMGDANFAGPSVPSDPAQIAKPADSLRIPPRGASQPSCDVEVKGRHPASAAAATAAATAWAHDLGDATLMPAALAPTYSSDTVAYAPGDHAPAAACATAGRTGRVSSSCADDGAGQPHDQRASSQLNARGLFASGGAASLLQAPATAAAPAASGSGMEWTGTADLDRTKVSQDDPSTRRTTASDTDGSLSGIAADQVAAASAPQPAGTSDASPHAVPRRLPPISSPSSVGSRDPPPQPAWPLQPQQHEQRQQEQLLPQQQAQQQPASSEEDVLRGEPEPAPQQPGAAARVPTRRSLFVGSDGGLGRVEGSVDSHLTLGRSQAAEEATPADGLRAWPGGGSFGTGMGVDTSALVSTSTISGVSRDNTALSAPAPVQVQAASASQPILQQQPLHRSASPPPPQQQQVPSSATVQQGPQHVAGAAGSGHLAPQTAWQVGATAGVGSTGELHRQASPPAPMQPPLPGVGPLQQPVNHHHYHHQQQPTQLSPSVLAAQHADLRAEAASQEHGTTAAMHAGEFSTAYPAAMPTTEFPTAAQSARAYPTQWRPGHLAQPSSYGVADSATPAGDRWAAAAPTGYMPAPPPPPAQQAALLHRTQPVPLPQQWGPPPPLTVPAMAVPAPPGSLLGSPPSHYSQRYAYPSSTAYTYADPLQWGAPAAVHLGPGSSATATAAWPAAAAPASSVAAVAVAPSEDEDVIVTMLKRKMDAFMDKLRSLERNLRNPPPPAAR